MKLFRFFALVLSIILGSVAARAACDEATLKKTYLPILKEWAEWPDADLMAPAKLLCENTEKKKAVQIELRDYAKYLRDERRVCMELGGFDENGNAVPECATEHAKRLNDLIDKCKEDVSIGHNPHNVGVPLQEVRVELACLRGVLLALKESN